MITTLALTLILGALDVPAPTDETYPATICRAVHILEAQKGGKVDFSYTYRAHKICWAAGVSWEELCEQIRAAYKNERGVKICAALEYFLTVNQPQR